MKVVKKRAACVDTQQPRIRAVKGIDDVNRICAGPEQIIAQVFCVRIGFERKIAEP